MPFVLAEPDVMPRAPTGVAPPTPLAPMLGETAAAAIRQDNPTYNLASRLFAETYPPEPGYTPLADPEFKGSYYEQHHADNFIASQSPGETRSIMRRIDGEERDRKILDASGTAGFVAQIGAGLIDPTVALPAGAIARSAKGGYSALRSAVSVGVAAGTQTAVQEAALQATQETRTAGESLAAIGSATVLGGLIGSGAASILTKAERMTLEKALDGDRAALTAHAEGLPEPQLPAKPEAAGAAAADTRQLELELSGLGSTAKLSPTRRVLAGPSIEARKAIADLAETPYRFKEGGEGVAATQGPALDRLARMEVTGTRVAVSDEFDRLFGDYRFGDSEQRFPRFKAQFERATGRDTEKMTFTEFKTEAAKALQEGDTHEIPQVQQAAQFVRQRVFDPWKQRAIDAGLLPEGIDPKTADSYFQRVYNKEKISAQRPQFVDTIANWLTTDQQTKAAAKDRMLLLNRDLQGVEDALSKAKTEDRTLALTASRDEIRKKLEAEIASWEGKSASEAKSAIKAREKYAAETARASDAPPLESAHAAIDRAVKRIIESDRNLSPAELRARADEVVNRILGSPDGRLPYDAPSGGPQIGHNEGPPPRGPLAARNFAIPDAMIRDWLEQDVEQVVAMHLRTMVPDVLLTERFGDTRMTEAFRKINDEYAAMAEGARGNEKKLKQIEKQRQADIRDIAAVRDRIRGVYGWAPELRNMARIANGAKAVNNLTSMGMTAVSSLPDLAGTVFRYGITSTLRDGWVPFFRNMVGGNEAFAKFKTQMRAIGIGTETAINARQHAIDDVLDVYKPHSRVERTLQAVSDKFFIANLQAPETDAFKTIAAHVAVSEILRATKAASAGTATKRMIANLAESGIDRQMAERIAAQFEKGGEITDGVHLPNTADWTDRAAADALNGAVGREVDIAVVTPGQEKPLWMSHPVLSLFGQFKSFTASSTERILVANLMRRDTAVLQGMVVSLALGMLSYKANSVLGGAPTSDRPQDWIKEAVSRGGMLGWFEEGNALASKATRGGVDLYRMIGADKPLGRYANRSTLDMLIGPTAGKVGSLVQATGAAAAGDWQESDTKAVRRLIAMQNLFYLRKLFDQVEEGANNAAGIPMRAKP